MLRHTGAWTRENKGTLGIVLEDSCAYAEVFCCSPLHFPKRTEALRIIYQRGERTFCRIVPARNPRESRRDALGMPVLLRPGKHDDERRTRILAGLTTDTPLHRLHILFDEPEPDTSRTADDGVCSHCLHAMLKYP